MNKKFNNLLTSVILIAGITFLFSSCESEDFIEAKVRSIEIKILPNKVDYYLGDAIDLSGLEITLTMVNSATENITFLDFEKNGLICSPQNGSVITEFITITITHSNSNVSKSLDIIIRLQDIESNSYLLVKIGDQAWTAENLKVTKLNDGTSINLLTNSSSNSEFDTPGYCWYDFDEVTYKDTYGGLYNYYAVNTEKLCPIGSHIPSQDEWNELFNSLGGPGQASIKIREAGTMHWVGPNSDATNSSGFTALPAGFGYPTNYFTGLGSSANFWTATLTESSPSTHGFSVDVDQNSGFSTNGNTTKRAIMSIRCVID